MEEDKGYEVVDKRRTASQEQAEPEPEPGPEAKAEAQAEEEPASGNGQAAEGAEEQAEAGIPAGDVYSIISLSIMMLAESAWQWMGLRVNPSLGKVEKDMAQAKIAIDSIVFLTDKIANHLPEPDRKALRAMINDLQINFVQQA